MSYGILGFVMFGGGLALEFFVGPVRRSVAFVRSFLK
jgi:hypothetical protein